MRRSLSFSGKLRTFTQSVRCIVTPLPLVTNTTISSPCLLLGMGLGLLTGYIICATTVPDYFTERNWRMSELTSLIYGANVLLFGGLGLVVAFIVELKISQKNRKDHTR